MFLFKVNYTPLVILNVCTSFSHDANEAFRTSVNFLFVPGVRGGICAGTSEIKQRQKKLN